MATISGVVEIEQDGSTSVYGGATVYVIDESTNTTYETTSASDGTFSVSGLDLGVSHTVVAVARDGQTFRSRSYPGVSTGGGPTSGIARFTLDDADTDASSGETTDVWSGNTGTFAGTGETPGQTGANQTYTTNEAFGFDGAGRVSTTVSDPDVPFSAAAWAYWDGGKIVASTRGGTDQGFGLHFKNGVYNPYIRDGPANTYRQIEGSSVTTGNWYHVAITVGAGTFTAYFNGAPDGSLSYDGYTPGSDVEIADDGLGNNLLGRVDDVRIYDKVLSDTEVSDLYNTGTIYG